MTTQNSYISVLLLMVKDTKVLKVMVISISHRASLIAQLVKNPPAMHETGVQSLGWEDPSEKEKATHSSILARKIPWSV